MPLSRIFALPTLLFAGFSFVAVAQTAPTTAPQGPLSAAELAAVQQLGTLNNLSEDTWRFHAGDVAHGESPTLDDSAWSLAKPKAAYPTEAVWFRQTIEVPANLHGYDLTGTRIWFQFRASANGPMPEIVYFNGRRVALGDDLEPIILFEDAKPGDKVLIAVKLLATVDQKHIDPTRLRVDFSPSRPNPDDLRQELSSANLLLPTLSKHLAADTSTLHQAVAAIDLAALNQQDQQDQHDQQRFDASLEKSQATLAALEPTLRQATFLVDGNSHIDAAWLWPRSETIDVVKRTFSTALQLMNEYPTYTFTQSAAQYNDWMADKYPQIDKEIKQRIKEGRWEVVGGMWVEPDLNLPDGESTARSILIGKRWFQQHYGVDVHIGWNPDSFGYNWQLPQIYKKSGIDFFVTQKMEWNDTNQLPFKLFWWQSPDGSKVLTYFPHGYANNNLSPVRLAKDLKIARADSPGMSSMFDLYGVGDHGGGPTRAVLDEGLHWMNADKVIPKMKFSTAANFFSQASSEVIAASPQWDYRTIAAGYHAPPLPPEGKIAIPTWKDELYLEYHRGVYTTQAAQKRNLRQSAEWALNAEKFASLAWLDGKPYPADELTEAWKKITFNGFHDLAAGSGIAPIYRDAQKDFDQVRWATSRISRDALQTIAARVDTSHGAGVPIFVFNPLGWKRSGHISVQVQMPQPAQSLAVLDPDGHVVLSHVLATDPVTHVTRLMIDLTGGSEVPSMGYIVLHVAPEKRAWTSDLHVDGTTLENSALRVAIDPHSGCITSLFDKRTHFEALAPGACGNELQAFHDNPKDYDAWNIDPGTLDQPPIALPAPESVEVVEHSPLRAIVRVTRKWQQTTIVQNIILYAHSDQVEVENDTDWHATHVLLKAAMPLAATAPFATYEIPYGSIERPTTRNNSWEKARFEVPALRWADLGDGRHGLSLINDAKYGYDAAGNLLRLTLLRSPTWPDPDADRGHQHFTYALYPHAGDWKQALTVRHGYEFNTPLIATQVEAHTGVLPPAHSFASVTPDNVVLTAVKKAEDSNALVLHLYEWAGKPAEMKITVPDGAKAAIETNLLEVPQGSVLPVAGDAFSANIKPFEIKAFRIDFAPAQAKQLEHEPQGDVRGPTQ